MSINLATKASDKVVRHFSIKSCTEGLFNTDYNWTGVKTLQVYTIVNPSLNDYVSGASGGICRFGVSSELGDTMQEISVNDDKAFTTIIDKGNYTRQMMVKKAGTILKQVTEEILIPYVDKYRLSALATGAGSKKYSVTLTKNNVIEEIFAAGAQLSNDLVPRDKRVLYIGETAMLNLKLADVVTGLQKLGGEAVVNGVIGVIDGAQVRVVPDNYMPTGVNFMLVHKGCAVAPVKVETYRVIEDDVNVDGSVVQGRFLHDCVVLTTRAKGIYACYSTAAPT